MPLPGAEPFLAAIVATPGDDLPRLVYADWLDEHGDAPRAEFIRIQCDLAGLGYEWADIGFPRRTKPDPADRLSALRGRQAELWQTHGAAWRAELPECPGTTLRFSRGFAGWADVTHPGGIMRDGDALFAAAPVTWLSVRGLPPEAIRVPVDKAGWFERVRRFSVTFRPPDDHPAGDEVAAILSLSPRTAGLQELFLANADVSDIGAIDLARSAFVGRLTRADLSHNRIGNDGAMRLAAALSADALEVLDLTGNPVLPYYRRQLAATFGDRVRFG